MSYGGAGAGYADLCGVGHDTDNSFEIEPLEKCGRRNVPTPQLFRELPRIFIYNESRSDRPG